MYAGPPNPPMLYPAMPPYVFCCWSAGACATGACCIMKSWCHDAAAFAACGCCRCNDCAGAFDIFRRWKSFAHPGACCACANCSGGCANCGLGRWKSCASTPGLPAWNASNSESSPACTPADVRNPYTKSTIRFSHCVYNVLTCAGECLPTKRSCCSVRSTVVCFWKLCRAFDGPHSASAMTAVQEKEKEEGVSPHAKIKRQKDGARSGGTRKWEAPMMQMPRLSCGPIFQTSTRQGPNRARDALLSPVTISQA
jgi:hypothetical protein